MDSTNLYATWNKIYTCENALKENRPINCAYMQCKLAFSYWKVLPTDVFIIMAQCWALKQWNYRINFSAMIFLKKSSGLVNFLNLGLQIVVVCCRPGQNRVTWKAPRIREFVPLQEPIAVLASYVPHTQMPVWSNTSVVIHNIYFV